MFASLLYASLTSLPSFLKRRIWKVWINKIIFCDEEGRQIARRTKKKEEAAEQMLLRATVLPGKEYMPNLLAKKWQISIFSENPNAK